MNLHRTLGIADWHDTAHADQSRVQRIAAWSKGVITPGNLISLVGLILVIAGCVLIAQSHYWYGGLVILVGRLLDILDGHVADKTGTKGPVGELVDASFDKIGTVATIITLFVAQIAAWPLLIALLIPQVAITLFTGLKRAQGHPLHPSLLGKLSMAAVWVAITGLVTAKATDMSAILALSMCITIGASVLGGVAAVQYVLKSAK